MTARDNVSAKRHGRPKRPLAFAKRPVWKGQLTFGLVGIPVELVPAVDSREHMGFTFSIEKTSRRSGIGNSAAWRMSRSAKTRS